MGRRIADLDERDYRTRVGIRTQLRARRLLWGWSQRDLGEQLGYEAANVRRLERAGVDQSFTVTVMRWARALGMRLVLQPVGFPDPAPSVSDPLEDLLAAVSSQVHLDGDAGDG